MRNSVDSIKSHNDLTAAQNTIINLVNMQILCLKNSENVQPLKLYAKLPPLVPKKPQSAFSNQNSMASLIEFEKNKEDRDEKKWPS